MAIGLGRMFGFRFPENFRWPYIADSVQEFWRRWHISLSSWFRDYLYVPLGGNRHSAARVYVNLVIVFFLCGLWHGASWNFVIWGLFHGAFLVVERLGLANRVMRLWRPLRHAVSAGSSSWSAGCSSALTPWRRRDRVSESAMAGLPAASAAGRLHSSGGHFLTPELWLALVAGADRIDADRPGALRGWRDRRAEAADRGSCSPSDWPRSARRRWRCCWSPRSCRSRPAPTTRSSISASDEPRARSSCSWSRSTSRCRSPGTWPEVDGGGSRGGKPGPRRVAAAGNGTWARPGSRLPGRAQPPGSRTISPFARPWCGGQHGEDAAPVRAQRVAVERGRQRGAIGPWLFYAEDGGLIDYTNATDH